MKLPETAAQRVQLLANLGIVFVCGVIVTQAYSRSTATPSTRVRPAESFSELRAGGKVDLEGIPPLSRRTVLLVYSKDCRFCTDSLPFYERLSRAAAQANVGFVVVTPDQTADVKARLQEARVQVEAVVAEKAMTPAVRRTPTLAVLRRDGLVVNSWSGQLPAPAEERVMALVQATQ